jgi:hypothetical protein
MHTAPVILEQHHEHQDQAKPDCGQGNYNIINHLAYSGGICYRRADEFPDDRIGSVHVRWFHMGQVSSRFQFLFIKILETSLW